MKFAAGTGLTSTLAMFPLETIRTRLAVDPKKYRNMLGAFHTIVEAEGAGALYRVCLPVLMHGGTLLRLALMASAEHWASRPSPPTVGHAGFSSFYRSLSDSFCRPIPI